MLNLEKWLQQLQPNDDFLLPDVLKVLWRGWDYSILLLRYRRNPQTNLVRQISFRSSNVLLLDIYTLWWTKINVLDINSIHCKYVEFNIKIPENLQNKIKFRILTHTNVWTLYKLFIRVLKKKKHLKEA